MLRKSNSLVSNARATSHAAVIAILAPLSIAIGLASSLALATKANAQGLPLIRDTEIEALLTDYAKPIFRAAGLGSGRVTVRIVRNDAFNAFVLDGSNVFVHTGALMQAQTPNEVIGVIAHETGHIAGGHMAALRARIAKDQTRALLTQILGIGAMIAGGVAGGDGGREALQGGQAVMQGGQDVIMRGLLSERRSQEFSRRPSWPQVSECDEAIRQRHARNIRTLPAAGICFRPIQRPIRSQPPCCNRSFGAAARSGGVEPLRRPS